MLVAGNLKNLLEDDLRAVYTFVKRSASIGGAADQPRQPYARWCGADADCQSGEVCAGATHECTGGGRASSAPPEGRC